MKLTNKSKPILLKSLSKWRSQGVGSERFKHGSMPVGIQLRIGRSELAIMQTIKNHKNMLHKLPCLTRLAVVATR
jgi:hypothetical protein